MKRLVELNRVKGEIYAPSSKSVAQRVAAICLLKGTPTEVSGMNGSEDILNSVETAKSLGAEFFDIDNIVKINGGLKTSSGVINCGEAGLGLRMFSPIVALAQNQIILTGEGSLLKRPVDMVKNALEDLGVECESNNGYLPLKIKGPYKKNEVTIDGSISSQFLTGLLIAKGQTDEKFIVHATNLKSRPYVDLTIDIMKSFDVDVINEDYKRFFINPGQKYNLNDYKIEGDWSGASFYIVAAALAGNIKINNLKIDSFQADKEIISAIEQVGADINISSNSIMIRKDRLEPFNFDATDCPDLFPPLVALAANINGISVIKGAGRLKHKESDRATVLKEEFAKIGIEIILQGDEMAVKGGNVKSGEIDSNNDHRIAMAGAVVAAGNGSTIKLIDSDAVNKSYMNFFNDFEKAGGNIEQLR